MCEDGSTARCLHEPLSQDQIDATEWMQEDSNAFRALRSMVTNHLLLRDMKQMTMFNTLVSNKLDFDVLVFALTTPDC